jgi:ferric enterobactin receptor
MKKIKYILSLLVLFVALAPAFAQTAAPDHSIKGMVKDSVTQKAADFITISLKNPAKQAIKSVLTKEDGSFSLEKIASGKYTVTVFSIGYTTKILSVDLTSAKQVDLGTILIKPESTSLATVTITADRPLVKQEVDRLSYDLQADPESKVNNVLEMMRKVPLLSVDAEDNILLKGDANYKILINGKPSSMMERSPKDILRSMPASTIQRIEVITTPPAKYDAEGVAGIINIITAKKIDNGYNASLNTSHRFPTGGPGLGGSFTFKQGKFGMSANGGISQYNNPQTSNKAIRSTDSTYLTQNGFRNADSKNGYFGTELSYEIDSLNLISGQFNINGGTSTNLYNQNSDQKDNRFGKLPQGYTILNNNDGRGHGADAALNYQLGFKSNKARLLTFSYRYFGYGNTQLNNVGVSKAVNFDQNDYKQSNKGSSSEQTFQVDYVHPLKKITIEAGVKGILRINKSNFQYSEQDDVSQLFVIDPSRTNRYNNTQDVFSAYNAYQYNLKTWGFKAGFRIEQTVIDADFISASSKLKRNYLNVVPSININKKFKDQSSINLGFAQRIQRPGIFMLNPFLDTSNPSFYSQGNPDLYPTANNEFILGYNKSKKASVNFSLGYSFFNNLIMPVSSFDQTTNITLNSFDNTGKARLFTLNSSINYPISKKWNASLNGRVAHGKVQGVVNGALVKNEGFMYNISTSTGYKFNKGWRVNGNFNMIGANLSIQGTSKPFSSSSVSVNKDIVKDKLSFSVASNNPFTKYRTNHSESFGYAPNFNQTNDNQTYFRSFSASMNYRFGKLKEGIKKSKREIRNDDVSGGGGGN